MQVGAVGGLGMSVGSMPTVNSGSCSAPLSNCQINSLNDKSNFMKLGIAMLLLHDKDEDCKCKKLAGALLLSAILNPCEKACNTYTQTGNMMAAPIQSTGLNIMT